MHLICTTEQIRAIDSGTINGDCEKGYILMKVAARGIADAVLNIVDKKGDTRIAVFCGKGNNGGDGFAAALLLHDSGCDVTCYSLCKCDDLQNEAKRAYDDYVAAGHTVIEIADKEAFPDCSKFSIIIDALLGNGLKGNPQGLYADAINCINQAHVNVVAADTPSGLDNNTGIPLSPCINARITVTMGYSMVGFYFYPGRSHVGQLNVQPLDYNPDIVEKKNITILTPDVHDLYRMLPPRHPAGSKHDHGLALLLCGSRGMSGSAALASLAALRVGCGMTHCAVPLSIADILSVKLTETVIHPLWEKESGVVSINAIEQVHILTDGKQAMCIGPGLGHDIGTSKLVRELVRSVSLPLILDADGLNAFKGYADELENHIGEVIITPHRGEWGRLFGPLEQEPLKLIQQVKTISQKFGITILLKGNPSICALPDGTAYILPFGNSALAKAGSGDVLSGCIVSLLAQGAVVRDAAVLGAYLLGQAGVIASQCLSEYSVVASDVIETIPLVIQQLIVKGQKMNTEQSIWNR
ncbi:MAG: NAD(P)H-hydrate dehydratase [Fibrobacterota bacterium]|nr:NAD(P)H-hydrate dehydratase [Chitinispirillaceae bacterium]